MRIVRERTRLIFYDYNPLEKKKIEDIVGTEEKVFTYEDPDGKFIAYPPGMIEDVMAAFPSVRIVDNSSSHWDAAPIAPVQHSAQPRNQLQIDFINFVLEHAKKKENVAGILSTGTGKGTPCSTIIPTPTGYTTMGNLKVGDRIFGSDGSVIHVTDIYDRGFLDVYKVTFNDGRYTICDPEHLWAVYTAGTPHKLQVKSTKDIMEDYKQYRPSNRRDGTNRDMYGYKYKIPLLSSPVQNDQKKTPIHPYVIGAFIGNGCLSSNTALAISSGDDFVPNKIAKLCGLYTRKMSSHGYTYNFYTTPNCRKSVVNVSDFFALVPSLCDYSYNKTIPEEYMYNSVEVRMELLRGLMDTDGSIRYADGRFNVSYSSTSERLLEQIQELIRGLGYIASIQSPDKRVDKYSNGHHAELSIRVPNKFKQELFTHPRKHKLAVQASWRGDYKQPFTKLKIKNIEYIGRDNVRCIRVDAPDELYLTEDFIVTHNTFMACYCAIKVGLRTLIITPTSSIKAQWGETLTGMFKVDPSRVLVVNSPRQFFNVTADFVVISQASLASINKTYDLEKIMKANKFGIKVIDEVQMWFHNIIKVDANSNIPNNWYITGTFGRSGAEENTLYQKMFGNLAIFREKQKEPTIFNRRPGNIYGMKPHTITRMVWAHSGISQEELQSVNNSIRYSERSEKWVRYGLNVPSYMNIVIPPDGTMTKLLNTILRVIRTAETQVTYGKTLIVGNTIAGAMVVMNYCKKMFPDKKVGTIHSRQSKAENDKAKAECDIIVSTTSSCGTGFDWKGLAKLINFSAFASWILADQLSGRLRRRDDGKETYMWDIVDADVKQLIAWANARADVERRKSKSFKVIHM